MLINFQSCKVLVYLIQTTRIFVSTFEFDAQFGEGLLHTLTLPLPHEAIVNVNCDHLILVQSFVEEGCANCRIHAATQQHLRISSETKSLLWSRTHCISPVVSNISDAASAETLKL